MIFRTAYDFKTEENFGTINTDDSLTEEAHAGDTNINVIMKRYGASGQLPTVVGTPLYGDFSEVSDFDSALRMIQEAKAAFAEIPADIRKEFDNDPGRFIAFCQDPSNNEKLKEFGLTNTPPKKSATLDDVVETLNNLKPKE